MKSVRDIIEGDVVRTVLEDLEYPPWRINILMKTWITLSEKEKNKFMVQAESYELNSWLSGYI